MTSKAARNQQASSKKMHEAANKQEMPESKQTRKFRSSPLGRRLAELKKKKWEEEK